jgi:hypothetical protein
VQQAAREKNISRAKAEQEGSFRRYIAEFGEPLISMLPHFEANFVEVLRKTTHWQCKDDMHRTYDFMLNGIPEVTPLASFLPQKKDAGILAMALWEGRNGDEPGAWWGPPNFQNKVYSAIHGPPGFVSGNPFCLTEKDLVTADVGGITDLINELFIVPGYQPYLVVAETLCKYGAPRLASFAPLASDLPENSYGIEGLLDLITTLQNRLYLQVHPSGENREFAPQPSNLTGVAWQHQ